MRSHFILFVSDQAVSTEFYEAALGMSPTLCVPGMTEFTLGETAVLGLMPETSSTRLFGDRTQSPSAARGIPRCEIYLVVSYPGVYHTRALNAAAIEISPMQTRDWGHRAAYSLDPDGHILAFAEEIIS